MKKKMLLIAGLCLVSTGLAMAEGIVFHAGLGYHASFLGTPIRAGDELGIPSIGREDILVFKNLPLGLSLFGGIGYAFGSEEKFSVGGEGALGWAVSLKPLGAFHVFLQGRAFGRYAPFEMFSVAGFAGVKANLAVSHWVMPSGTYPVFGVRAEFFLFCFEYGIVLRGNFSKVYSHDIVIGFMFIS